MSLGAARRRDDAGVPYLYLVDSDGIDAPASRGRFHRGFTRGVLAGITVLVIFFLIVAKWFPQYVYMRGLSDWSSSNQITSERLIAQGYVAGAAERVKPGVVTIETGNKRSGRDHVGAGNGVGAGIVVRSNGYIVTNQHVVADAKSIVVRVAGRRVKGLVVGVDKTHDIAVLRAHVSGLTVPEVASAEEIEVGELAVAVGAPFGFSDSVSAGVISGLERSVTVSSGLPAPRTYRGLVQTDAAINPGNSGGPLVDRSGRVVGMNSLIYSTTGLSQGVGFAIPMEEVVSVADRLISEHEAALHR